MTKVFKVKLRGSHFCFTYSYFQVFKGKKKSPCLLSFLFSQHLTPHTYCIHIVFSPLRAATPAVLPTSTSTVFPTHFWKWFLTP